MTVLVGTAGWGLSREGQERFGPGGSVLERYATRLSAAEINSSFYRPHRRSTYRKWAASVPEDFRFSVKAPKAVTHTAKLRDCAGLLADFMEGVNGLGDSLGALLVQLPPSLKYEPEVAADFFAALRQETSVPAVCEPRHASWFGAEADILLRQFHIEGFVNTYKQSFEGGATKLVFESEGFENFSNSWKARESCEFDSDDRFVETFELAPPGKDFEVYSRAEFRRVK